MIRYIIAMAFLTLGGCIDEARRACNREHGDYVKVSTCHKKPKYCPKICMRNGIVIIPARQIK